MNLTNIIQSVLRVTVYLETKFFTNFCGFDSTRFASITGSLKAFVVNRSMRMKFWRALDEGATYITALSVAT